MPAIRSWSSTFRVSGQPGPASSCTMAARCPPPSGIPRAIRKIPCRGTSCLPNTRTWGAVCCLRTGLPCSPSACAIWSPPRPWRRSGVCSVVRLCRRRAQPFSCGLRRVTPHLHRVTFQQPAGDDEPLDLIWALAHGEELGVAEVALHGQLLDVAHATVDLNGLAGAELGSLGGEELGHARLQVAAPARRLEPGRLVGQELGSLDARGHLGELGLDELVLRDGLTKGLALLGVTDRVLEGRPGQTYAARRHIDAPA